MTSYTITNVDHREIQPTASSVFSFDTSKFAGKHKAAVAEKIASAKTALRAAQLAYHAAIAAIEGKPAPKQGEGTLVVCSRRFRFTRTEKQQTRQITGHVDSETPRILEGEADIVVEIFDLEPGKPSSVPAWVTKQAAFRALQRDGVLSAL